VSTTVTAHKIGVPGNQFFSWIRKSLGPLHPKYGQRCGRGKYN